MAYAGTPQAPYGAAGVSVGARTTVAAIDSGARSANSRPLANSSAVVTSSAAIGDCASAIIPSASGPTT